MKCSKTEKKVNLKTCMELCGKPCKEMHQANEKKMEDQSFTYQMLSRLQMDCEYYLGNGGRYDPQLWAGNPVDQIKEMRRLYDLLHEKPEWLTPMDAIEVLDS